MCQIAFFLLIKEMEREDIDRCRYIYTFLLTVKVVGQGFFNNGQGFSSRKKKKVVKVFDGSWFSFEPSETEKDLMHDVSNVCLIRPYQNHQIGPLPNSTQCHVQLTVVKNSLT